MSSRREIIFDRPLPETVFDHQLGRHEYSPDCACDSCELLQYRKMTHREGSVEKRFHSYRGTAKDNHDGRRTLLEGVAPHRRRLQHKSKEAVAQLTDLIED